MPLTTEKYEKTLAQPPLCEQLKEIGRAHV